MSVISFFILAFWGSKIFQSVTSSIISNYNLYFFNIFIKKTTFNELAAWPKEFTVTP